MQRILPRADFGARRWPPERIAGLAFALLVPAAFVYAFVSGMAQNFVHSIPALLEVRVAPPQEETTPPPPPPPMPTVVEPAAPTLRAPVIRIARPEPARDTITVREGPSQPPAPTNFAPIAPAAPPPPPTSAEAVAGTHTTPPYPLIARRLSEQGTVRLKIALSDAGAVLGVEVVRSSGHQSLDEAAVSWVKSHWVWRPATRAGTPVASTTIADIVFDLRES